LLNFAINVISLIGYETVKRFFALLVFASVSSVGFASLTAAPSLAGYVKGYTRRDGTYVAPHYRSNPNGTKQDNYSTYGNANPYTGKKGTKKCSSFPCQ